MLRPRTQVQSTGAATTKRAGLAASELECAEGQLASISPCARCNAAWARGYQRCKRSGVMRPTATPVSAGEVFCPECGYDLRGIPEHRCPECGFGYQHAAIRMIANGSGYRRLAGYQRLVRIAGAALVCCALALAGDVFSILGGRSFQAWVILVISGLITIELWFACCVIYWTGFGCRFFTSAWKPYLAMQLVPLLIVGAVLCPLMYRLLGAGCLILNLVVRLQRPERYPKAALSLTPGDQNSLRRWAIAAWLTTFLAAAGVFTEWLAMR